MYYYDLSLILEVSIIKSFVSIFVSVQCINYDPKLRQIFLSTWIFVKKIKKLRSNKDLKIHEYVLLKKVM